jgi:L-2-hydroxyglutarate oxidase
MRRSGSWTPARPGTDCDIAVIGGGIVGLAAAYKLLLAWPGAEITVLEKEVAVARHQSGRNSGVLHAGLSYGPGSFKARFARQGLRQMTAFCREHQVPFAICGKLVVAVTPAEVTRLRALMARGAENGLSGLEWLEAERIGEVEPYAAGLAALRVPEEGIVDFPAVCAALERAIASLGGHVRTAAGVRALRRESGKWTIHTDAGDLRAWFVVNCAGLYADRVAALAGERVALRIVPFRGEYYALRPDRAFLVRHLIYPVADPAFPFLGVHLTRTVSGAVLAGPNAVLAFAREGYHRSTVSLPEMAGSLGFLGLWRFLARHPRRCAAELWRSLSRDRFVATLRRLVPELRADDLDVAKSGVRAQAMLPSGELVNDFVFMGRPGALHVLNAPSPAATAALAIGDEIVSRTLAAVAPARRWGPLLGAPVGGLP